MWTLSLADVHRIKGQLEARRARIEAKYQEEMRALEAEHADIETLERVASAFAVKYQEPDAPESYEAEGVNGAGAEIVAAEAVVADSEANGDGEAEQHMPSTGPSDGSKWRLRIRRNEAAALAESE